MKYEDLVTLVRKHGHLYYDLSAPEISDAEYDNLYDNLVSVEEKQGWKLSNSPTIKVGGSAGKIKHPFKLYSLKKVYEESEVEKEFTIKSPKIDGANLTLIYQKGNLQLALTRGDGNYGDDISHLTSAIFGIPENLKDSLKDIEELAITGECVTDNLDIENFRNYVSGALGLKSAEECKSRNIRFIAHDLLGVKLPYTTRMELISRESFRTVLTDSSFCMQYPHDGLVYRLDDYFKSQELGYTSKYPRFAVALKERNQLVAVTRLQKVEWAVGRTGTVNPVGIVNPVILDGATITRVTLHNIDIIEKHALGLGDLIQIERAGGVIPKFIQVMNHSNHDIVITSKDAAKAIGGEVYKKGPKLYVKNPEKFGTVKLLNHFIKILGIKGLGPQSIDKLKLNHPSQLYVKQNWDLLGVNGNKIQQEIKRSKTKPYSLVLAALGIEGVGRAASEKIVKIIPNFDRLKEIEYVDIPTIGPKTKEKILVWLVDNESWVSELPLQLEEDISILEDVTTDFKKVCISGKLDYSKSEMKEMLQKFGIDIVNSVTKDSYGLISDGKKSSKYLKAEKYKIKIINYWENKHKILRGEI